MDENEQLARNMKFELEFVGWQVPPTKEGEVLLYNQCDGYRLAEVRDWPDGSGFRFCDFLGYPLGSFCAYAYLPSIDERINGMYEAFARKPNDE